MVRGPGIRVDIEEIPQWATRIIAGGLSKFAGDIRSVREPLEQAVREVLRPRIQENFRSESAAGEEWEELSWFMPYRWFHHKESAPKLDVTGNLKRVATSLDVWEFDGQTGRAFISDLPGAEYGVVHQFGGRNYGLAGNMKDIPARPFIAFTDEDLDRVEEIFADYIERRLNVNLGTTLGAGAISGLIGSGSIRIPSNADNPFTPRVRV